MSLPEEVFKASVNGNKFFPEISISKNFKHWVSIIDNRRCEKCEKWHGKIWPIEEEISGEYKLHIYCRCEIKEMQTIKAGTATINGIDGADWHIKYYGKLPDYYISDIELLDLGWYYGDKVSKFAPQKMITFEEEYKNDDMHLPNASGRIWYEADMNYKQGKRNKHRIVWSNDGLVFVTYDHYKTFYEIV